MRPPRVFSGVFGWQGLWLQLGGSFLRVNDNHVWGSASGLPSGYHRATGQRTAATARSISGA